MKRALIVISVFFVVWSAKLNAQQDPLYTQYRSNMLAVNPAYAGSRDALTANMLMRLQWVGFEGAPETQTLTIHGPLFHPNLGFGASLIHDKIGPVNQTGVNLDFSGRVKLTESGFLAGGVKLGLNFFKADLTSVAIDNQSDPSFAENASAIWPNIGFGLYYYTPQYYLGISSPKLIQNVLQPDDVIQGQLQEISEKRHYFAIAGMVMELSPMVKLRPSVLGRFVMGSPNSFDFTGTIILDDKIWIGSYYRLKESVGVILEYNFTPQLKVGYSYDHTLSSLRLYHSGSHEFSVTYDFIYHDDRKIKSPRYF